jgi:predicted DNA-binding transcriptional regulator AlpA
MKQEIEQAGERYLQTSKVRERYGTTDMTLWRWLHDETLAFPAPMRINGRRFWKLADLEAWESAKAAKSGEAA